MPLTVRCAAVTLLAVTPLAAQSAPLWRYAATAPVSFFQVTPLGNVVVATADGLVGLDPDSGTVIWTRDDLRNLEPASYVAIRQSPFATVQVGERVELIDLVTGATRWSTPPWADLEPYLPIPERGLLLAYGSNDSLEHVLVALDLETGGVRWERAQPFNLGKDSVGPQPALWVSDTTFLLYIPGHGPVLMHAGTGEWLWGADKLQGWGSLPLLGVPAWVRGGAMLLGDSVVYVSLDNRLHALRTRDGAPIWAKSPRLPTSVAQLELTPRGIFVLGRTRPAPWLRLIDPATGESRWSKRFGGLLKDAPEVTSFVVAEGHVYIAVNEKLVAVSLEDGSTTEVARVEFKGGEHPFLLERRGPGLLLIGNQNLMLVDSTGAERYHTYHPAPGRSTLANVGLGVLAVVANAASLAASALSTMDPASRSGSYSGLWFPDLGKRYAASEQARNYVYSVAHEEDSTGHKRPVFLRLHKDDGAVDGRVWLEEKRPEYQLDPITGMLYVRDGREILAFQF
jgi:outer membrane protein assembly factor BamB